MAERATQALYGDRFSYVARERFTRTPVSERRRFDHVRICTDVHKLMELGIYKLDGDTLWDVSDPNS